jgi:hypothetical protein
MTARESVRHDLRADVDSEGSGYSKPCQTLGYCPYGPLVEQFPIKEKRDDESCRIFGHQCPVFFTAEMFVEGDLLVEEPSRHIDPGKPAKAATKRKGTKSRSPGRNEHEEVG